MRIRSLVVSESDTAPRPPYAAFIIDPDPVWRQNALRTVSAYAESREATDLDVALAAMTSAPANIMVFGPHTEVSVTGQIAPLLRRFPQMGVLLVMDSLDIDGLRDALRAGVREVLPASTNPDELQQAVGRLTDVTTPLPAGPIVVPQARTKPKKRSQGRLVMVCSAKGGTGVSSVAINLAAAMASEGRSVALCDADPVFGDLPLLLGLKPRAEIEPGELPKRLQPEEVIDELKVHEPTGVQFFGMYRAHLPLHELPEDLITATFAGLQAAADVAVIDLPAPLVSVAEYLVHADELFFVAGTDVASLKNLRLSRQMISDAGLPLSKSWMVLNRIRNMADFEPAGYSQIVGLPVVCAIPDSLALLHSGESSRVLVEHSPRDPAARALTKFAQDLGGRFDEIDTGAEP